MDSLTQIVLGAACGEVALGKKIGNKALLFGAIGGTIPDLDVILGSLFYSNSLDQLAFHRGFMHSVMFAFIASFVLGMGVYKLYDLGKKRKNTTTQKDWIWLFFLSIFTHPVLDSFTPYGTQLFLPFSNYRVAFNNIAVVDPLYTFPFLFCLIIVLFYNRKSNKRTWWNRVGIYISSAYMILTLINKLYVDSVFKKSFKEAKVNFSRFSAQPTIFNNILWYGIAETKEDYKIAFFSLLDDTDPLENIISLPKNHHLLDIENDDIKTLRWFSNDYFNVHQVDSLGTFRYNDLRYPLLNPEDKNSSIFSFRLQKNGNRWEALPLYDRAPNKKDLQKFWERIKGL
ncbi:metal-dependent hydrolase [Tenacibaculum sp. IB213877]|uniref:metal-dependent hydrolase n=1 Tax=Tenacibaculum sp. IB213877 TaxID=3097351 RepID=UPI002A5A930E|nr:metal-dependent hydrolase [Tenacibaculum sp. IB213877]MDY0780772.1 metal-dependent hydrolase [Tenacibaculum sp. IB213877]